MRIKFWLASILKSFRILPSRSKRRWIKKKYASRLAAAGLAVAASTSVISSTAVAQCDGPLFPSFQTFPANDRPTFVTSGDFNGDGLTDLATSNENSDDVSVLLGIGDGTFEDQQTFAVGNAPRSITTGDFNGDGVTDLATSNDVPGGGSVSLLLGNGDGTFADQQSFAAGSGPASVKTGDFDGDGFTDVAVANDRRFFDYSCYCYYSTVSVLLGNGDGTLAPRQTYEVAYSAGSLTTADFNGDGLTDLATAGDRYGYNEVGRVSVLLGNGDGTFSSGQGFAAGTGPDATASGDFNGDGLTDLVTVNGGNAISFGEGTVALGNGNGTFAPTLGFGSGFHAYSVTTGDFNGDGLTDLAIGAVQNYYNSIVSVRLGNGDGTFSFDFQDFVVDTDVSWITTGDFNGDGLTDIATSNFADEVTVLLNQCKASSQTVLPDAFTVFRGNQVDGTLSDAFDSDDSRMRFNPGFTVNSTEAPVWLIFDAALSSDNANSLEIIVESQAGTPGLTGTFEAFNWTSAEALEKGIGLFR